MERLMHLFEEICEHEVDKGQNMKRLHRLWQPLGHARALDQARRDAIHRHVRRQGDGQAVREMDQPRLAGRVSDAGDELKPWLLGVLRDPALVERVEQRSAPAAERS